MRENGIVYKTYRNGFAQVRLSRKTACENCRMCLMPKDEMYVKVKIKNTINAKVGDIVTIEMKERAIISASIIVYVFPLILVGILLWLTSKLELWISLTVSLGSLPITYLGVCLIDKYVLQQKEGYAPKILSVDNVDEKEIIELKQLLKGGKDVKMEDDLGVYTFSENLENDKHDKDE
ncbi:MAG TPA: SoxR reducing system RseC family protein [Clostridia bacterium]|jgi:positive regulator of sigma E activity|nr:SoxR reducing system RseC family protein [Clostridia bacterium]